MSLVRPHHTVPIFDCPTPVFFPKPFPISALLVRQRRLLHLDSCHQTVALEHAAYGVARNMDVIFFPETGLDIDCRLALAGSHHPSDQAFIAVGEQTRMAAPWQILVAPVDSVAVKGSGHR
jgi:hypothetical protein